MVTKNGKILLRPMEIDGNYGKYFGGVTSATEIYNVQNPFVDWSNNTLDMAFNNIAIAIGTGTTPVTENDVMLENAICMFSMWNETQMIRPTPENKFFVDSVYDKMYNTSESYDDDSGKICDVIANISNISNNDYSVTEIGVFVPVIDSNEDYYWVMITRNVFDTPMILKAGRTYTIEVTIE